MERKWNPINIFQLSREGNESLTRNGITSDLNVVRDIALFHLKAMGEFYPAVWEWKSKPAAKKTFFSDEYPKENRLLITAVILKITVKKCFWLFRDNTHPFLFLSNCLQNPLGLCSVSVWSHVESYAGIVSSITVQKQESCRNPRNPEKYWIFQKQNRNHIYKWL